jgi:hypothetical protein
MILLFAQILAYFSIYLAQLGIDGGFNLCKKNRGSTPIYYPNILELDEPLKKTTNG